MPRSQSAVWEIPLAHAELRLPAKHGRAFSTLASGSWLTANVGRFSTATPVTRLALRALHDRVVLAPRHSHPDARRRTRQHLLDTRRLVPPSICDAVRRELRGSASEVEQLIAVTEPGEWSRGNLGRTRSRAARRRPGHQRHHRARVHRNSSASSATRVWNSSSVSSRWLPAPTGTVTVSDDAPAAE